jgi:hypothetical protein
VALAPVLWRDPDVRWLTGVHESEGHVYLVCEQYEELLWWLLMPSLLKLAQQPAPSRTEIARLNETVKEALASAKAAGYRVDELLRMAEPVTEEAESVAATEESDAVDKKAEPVNDPWTDRKQ